MLAPVLVTPATVKPLTLDEAKAQLNVDHSDDDLLISAMIDAAVSYLDGYSGIYGRALIDQTWKVSADGFSSCMRLPVDPLQSITSVKYYDTANVQQTLAGTVYGAYSDALGPFVTLKSGQSWPSVYSREDAIEITWVAGFGPDVPDVPPAVVHAIRLLVAHWYANRETVNIGNITSILDFTVDALIGATRRQHI